MVCVHDADFTNWTEVDSFGELVAFVKKVLKVVLLIAVGADVDAEVFVRYVSFVEGDGDLGIVSAIAILDSDLNG